MRVCTCVRMGKYFNFQQLEKWVQMQEVPLGQEASLQAVQGEEVEDLGTCRWVVRGVEVPSWEACHPVGGRLEEVQASSGLAWADQVQPLVLSEGRDGDPWGGAWGDIRDRGAQDVLGACP